MEDKFIWRERYPTICNAPLQIIDANQLDENHPAKNFLKYWTTLGKGKLPNKADFHPEAIPSILKWFMVFRQEIQQGNDLYHLFLQGTAAAELTCGSLQGQYLHEFTSKDCFLTRRNLIRHIVEEEKPGFASLDLKENNSEFYTEVTVGMFPMTDKDGIAIFVLPAPTSDELRARVMT